MRQIGNLPDMEQALTLADYLLSLQIETRLEHEPDGRWAIWVCDEDRMAQARDELAAFQKAPDDPRFVEGAEAERIRRRTHAAEEEEASETPANSGENARRQLPVTLMVMLTTVVVGLLYLPRTENILGHLTRLPPALRITVSDPADPTLPEIREGQLWRLVAPIFIHVSISHWLFNMLWFVDLGGQIERRAGSLRLLLLVLALAVFSNLAQFYLGHPLLINGSLHLVVSSNFGGLSGVVYGLFGYVWVKDRYEPDLGFVMPTWLTWLLLLWLILCFTPVVEAHIGSVANAAHVAGLLAGLVIGGVPPLWRAVRGR